MTREREPGGAGEELLVGVAFEGFVEDPELVGQLRAVGQASEAHEVQAAAGEPPLRTRHAEASSVVRVERGDGDAGPVEGGEAGVERRRLGAAGPG